MRNTQTITLQVQIHVPANVRPEDVEEAINAALDEPPCDWGLWKVDRATRVDTK